MQAMILAAGLGTRLRPYSLLRPKPLFPVMNVPLLNRVVERLRDRGFGPILVNAHHLHGQIVQALAGYKDVAVQVETEILGTGGALRLARDRFEDQPLLVVNGDICHDIDPGFVLEAHLRSGAAATLVLHDFPRFNAVYLDRDGEIRGFARTGPPPAAAGRRLAFTGLQVVSPRLFEGLPKGKYADLIDCYQEALTRGAVIRGLVVEHCFWTDIGTPQDYLALHRRLLTDAGLAARICGREAADGFYTGSNLVMGPGVTLRDWGCIGDGVAIGAGAALSRVVVWDGAVVPENRQIHDAIVT